MADPSAKRVLIIDDEEATRYVFRRILVRAGYEVDEAATGSEGLTKALSLPDVVISDVNLPDMLGYEVSRRLKSNPLTTSIPVLQISASFVSNESKVQGLEEGADSYLTQPVEPMVLVAQVNALLRMRRAESLSHLSALQWQSTFDSLSDGLALADGDGLLVRANATFMRLLDLVYSDIERVSLAKVFKDCFGIELVAFLRENPAGKGAEVSSGSRWFRIRYDTVESDPAHLSGSILIVTEITDHKKLQETLKVSERLAATGRLAHIIAHEINNPLEAMSNLLYLAAQDNQDVSETHEYILQASEELTRISTITRQILSYHRESATPSPVVAGDILEGVLAVFRTHILNGGVSLSSRVDCPLEILVRPGELRQVFSNLITNAIDAMSRGTRKLHVRCIPSVSYPSRLRGVRFLFSDTGTGIPTEVLPHIFEAFYTTKDVKGSGIGLWLSSEVISKYSGRIRIRTRTEGPYKGTLFDIFLPLSSTMQ